MTSKRSPTKKPPTANINEAFGVSKDGAQQESSPSADTRAQVDSIFSEQQCQESSNRKWWQLQLLMKEQQLFGTWDGVFTTVMLNIFGVIAFLRTGWIVGVAGLGHSVLLLIMCSCLSLVSVLSAVGICERCQIQSGGIYFLIAHILGAKIGAAVSILYVFGQTVSISMVAVGFGESVAHILTGESDNIWIVKLFAIGIILIMLGINLAGVAYVIRVQVLLLLFVFLAVFDLMLGSLFRHNKAQGVIGYSSANFRDNTPSQFTHGETLFSVFGVFYSNFIGVLSGVNMAADLKDPNRNIPAGELAAIGCSSVLCFIFMMILAGTCDRHFLLTDHMIAEDVSATRVLFLIGLYIASFSSIISTLYGTPRVLQAIAAENIIPFIRPFEIGKGANNFPVYGLFLLSGISIVFVVIGNLNTLAIYATIPFLITYATINYAYVSLAMSYDMQQAKQLSDKTQQSTIGYGSMGNIQEAQSTSDLDHLFPERQAARGGWVPTKRREGDKAMLIDDDVEGGGGGATAAPIGSGTLLGKEQPISIINLPQTWYALFCNRWISFIGAIVDLFIIFPMNFTFAIINIAVLILLHIYIGRVSPTAFAGISEFSVVDAFKSLFSRFRETASGFVNETVIPRTTPSANTQHERLNEQNEDYADRKQYHQTETRQLQ